MKNVVCLSIWNAPKGKKLGYILILIVRKGNILIPKGQKERKSVTFAIRLRTIWYDREGVKFRDSGSEIERNVEKRQICHTLPERSVGTSLWRPKIVI